MILQQGIMRILSNYYLSYNFSKIITTNRKYESIQMAGPDKINRSISKSAQILLFKQNYNQTKDKELSTKDMEDNFMIEMTKMNIDDFESKLLNRNQYGKYQKILKSLWSQKTLSACVQIIINRKTFGKKQKMFMTKTFHFFMKVFIKAKQQAKYVRDSQAQPWLQQFIQLINQYFMVLQLDVGLIIDYTTLVIRSIREKLYKYNKNYLTNQKIIIDYLLDTQSAKLKKNQIYTLINYVNMGNLNQHYPLRFIQFLRYLIKGIPQNSLKNQSHYNLKTILRDFSQLQYINDKLEKGFQQIMKLQITQSNFACFALCLDNYIKLNAVSYHDKEVPEYLMSLIIKFIKGMQKYEQSKNIQSVRSILLNQLMPNFYRASIWLTQFWLPFLDWLDTASNYKQVRIFHLYTIYDLIEIDKDVIPEVIITRLKKSKQNLLLTHNLKIEDIDLLKLYFNNFGDNQKYHYTMQQQITNNLRATSLANVKSQVLVRLFIVDILINDKIVFQVNSDIHYIFDERSTKSIQTPSNNSQIQSNRNQNQKSSIKFAEQSNCTSKKRLALKDNFKKRIIQKLGYDFVEFQLEQLTEGNYSTLLIFQDLINNSKLIPQKNNNNNKVITENQNNSKKNISDKNTLQMSDKDLIKQNKSHIARSINRDNINETGQNSNIKQNPIKKKENGLFSQINKNKIKAQIKNKFNQNESSNDNI